MRRNKKPSQTDNAQDGVGIKDEFEKYALAATTLRLPAVRFYRWLWALPAYHLGLLAVLMVLMVHVAYLPIWLTAFGVISLVMALPAVKKRLVGTQKQLKRRYQFLQLLGFVLGLLGIWLTFGQIFGADVSICFLVLCLFAKVWELYQKRDGYVLLNLCLFVLAAAFLWSQGIGVTFGVLIALMMVLLGFIALADDDNTTGAGRFRSLLFVALPAVPLLVVLFLFFPRLPPLWSIQMAGKQATTGVSDSMSPGDFANLSRSAELAFRVEFAGQKPARQDLYWRAMVFSDFDGITWRPSGERPNFWRSVDETPPVWATALSGKADGDYRVMMEPTHQNWLPSLDYSRLKERRGLGMTDEFTLRSYQPIDGQFFYRADYYPNIKVGITLDGGAHQRNLALPASGNDQAKAFAATLFAKSNHDPVTYINNIRRYVVDNGFSYTLSPPVLHHDRIDEFLFGTKAGFCEHYASSFVFLMRAAGVPARVVAGYQGGELGRDGQSWEVRQMDAHAWAEVWLANRGWVRVDPTAFVSPNRIEAGMNALTEGSGAQMFGDGLMGQFGYQQFRLLQSLYRLSDQASYYWQKDVVGFDGEHQKSSLLSWFNIKSLAEQITVLGGGITLVLSLFGLGLWYRRRVVYHDFDKPVARLSRQLAKTDKTLAKAGHESYLGYLHRLAEHYDNDELERLAGVYRQHRFGRTDERSVAYRQARKDFASALARVKRRL